MFLSSRRESDPRAPFFYRLTAGSIGLTLFLAPLELPLSRIANDETSVLSLKSTSEKEIDKDTPVNRTSSNDINSHTITYTRGSKPLNRFPLSETATEAHLFIANTASSGLATSKETININPLKSRTHKISVRALENQMAAEAVAKGDTGSELASVTLDEEGNIVTTVDTHGGTKYADYNEAGQPVKITDADGTVTYYHYDEAGHLLSISRDAKVAYGSGLKGVAERLVTPLFAWADSADENTTYNYEAKDISTASNNAGSVQYEYDENGLVTLETRLDGSQVEYEYDELGNVISAIEVPKDKPATLSWANFFRFSYASNPLLTTVREWSTYNDNNQVSNFRIAEVTEAPTPEPTLDIPEINTPTTSSSTTNPTNLENAVISTSSPIVETPVLPLDGTIPTSTPSTSVTTTEIINTEATSTNTNIIETVVNEVTAYVHKAGAIIAFWFDSALNRSFAEEASSTQASTTTETQNPIATSTTLYEIFFTYDAQGNVTKSETNSGIITTYTYDSVNDSLIATEVTTKAGEVWRENQQVNSLARITGSNSIDFGYSPDNMLVQAGTMSYAYDTTGNRTKSSDATYTYEGNRLLSVTYTDGRVVNYEYDSRGAVAKISDSQLGDTTFTYNLAGSIESITKNGETVSYEYDALNRRTSRSSTNGSKLIYHYSSNLLKRVTDTSDNTLREYFYTPTGKLTAIKSAGTFYHVITSYNKSITGLVDTTTGVMYTATYDIWGNMLASTLPTSIDIGYIGAFTEPAFGYSILGPRVYSPAIGRFLSKDPLPGTQADILSQNEYIYAKNDPVNQYDPSGHASELATESVSPKRSLADTNAAIAALEKELGDAKATLTITDRNDADAYVRAEADVANIETALNELYAIRTETKATISENEAEAKAEVATSTTPMAITPTVWTAVASTSSSDTVTENTATSTPSSTEITSTSTDSATTSTSEIVVPPATTTPASDTATTTVTPTDTTTPAVSDTVTVSLRASDGLLVLASMVFGDHLLKAEAKKKSKAKKASKSKKQSTSKAKSKQQSKASKVSSLKKKVSSLQKKLNATKNKNARSRVTKAQLASIEKDLKSATIDVLKMRVVELELAKSEAVKREEAAAEKAKAQALANSMKNLDSNVVAQANAVSINQPAPYIGSVQVSTQSAGVSTPQTSFSQPTSWWLTATSVTVSLVPVVGEVYDIATLLMYKDPITGETLNKVTALVTFVGLASGYASGKLTREAYTASLKVIANELGVTVDEVAIAAETVATRYGSYFTSVDNLIQLKGKLSFASFLDQVKVVTKENKVLLKIKHEVSAETIAKYSHRINENDIKHILDGVETSNPNVLAGGHRNGQATYKSKNGQSFGANHTEFPESWSDDKILESVIQIIDSPISKKYLQPDGKMRYEDMIDGLMVRVITESESGRVITGFPI